MCGGMLLVVCPPRLPAKPRSEYGNPFFQKSGWRNPEEITIGQSCFIHVIYTDNSFASFLWDEKLGPVYSGRPLAAHHALTSTAMTLATTLATRATSQQVSQRDSQVPRHAGPGCQSRCYPKAGLLDFVMQYFSSILLIF